MQYRTLEAIKWHDLPVEEIRFSSKGIHIVACPYDESERGYAEICLTLSSIEGLDISISGSPSVNDLKNIEVVSFRYTHLDSCEISGTVELLPGQSGLWRIAFSRAKWALHPSNKSVPAKDV